MENIKVASQEQAEGVDQINRTINDMDRITQENSALVEQNAAASQHMAEEADNMQNLLNMFRVKDDEALPAPEEKPQIVLDSDKNKGEESEQLVIDEMQVEENKKNIIKTGIEKSQTPFK